MKWLMNLFRRIASDNLTSICRRHNILSDFTYFNLWLNVRLTVLFSPENQRVKQKTPTSMNKNKTKLSSQV
jgi:hypothetical protein